MSSIALSRSSISKQRGAEMSSRLMPPKLGREPGDGLDDLLDVGGVQADRDGVDAAELLEQHRLALHHRHRGGGPDVAQPEHGGAVGDHGDDVGHPRVVLGHRRVGRDRLAHPGHAGRVGQRELLGPGRGRPSTRSPSCRRRGGRRRGRRRAGAAVPCGDTSTAQGRVRCRPSRGEGHTRASTTARTSALGHRARGAGSRRPRRGCRESSHQPGSPGAERAALHRPLDGQGAVREARQHEPRRRRGRRRTGRAAGRPPRSVGSIERPRTTASPSSPRPRRGPHPHGRDPRSRGRPHAE